MSKTIIRKMYGNNISNLNTTSVSDGISAGKSTPLVDLGSSIINGVNIVGSTHTHPNKYLLDGLSVDSEEKLHYYSSLINVPLLEEAW